MNSLNSNDSEIIICVKLVFIDIAMLINLAGAIIPMRENPKNITDWAWIRHELVDNKGQDAFGFAFSILSALGVCTIILYLVSLPAEILKNPRPRAALK